MRCPHCGTRDTRVVDSRDLDEATTIRRRRECPACTTRFTTYERVEAARLIVVKRDGTRQEFDRDKLADGLGKALTRRPVAADAADRAADAIEAELRSSGLSEVPSSRIGALSMDRLRALDHIGYIRFASVYQSFEDLEDLKREVDTLFAEGVAPKKARRARMSVLADRDIRAELEAGRVAHRSVRPCGPPAVVGRPPSRPQLPRVPQQPLRVHRPPDAAARPHGAPHDRRRRAVRPAPGGVRARADPRVGRAARRPRGRLEGKSSLGRLGLLIHSTAGYVDPGWKGNLTLELSNVANLPIALYYGMRIGQISFFRMSSPVERPYGSQELGSKYQGQSEPTASALHADFERGRKVRVGAEDGSRD